MSRPKRVPEEIFGRRMARLRKTRGLSQRELAKRIGISGRMVAYWEIQTDRPPAHLLAALSRELKVTPEELLGLKPVPVEAPPVDMRVWKKLQKVDELDRHGRKAVLDFIDAMLAKQKAQKEKRNATSRDREKENSAVQK